MSEKFLEEDAVDLSVIEDVYDLVNADSGLPAPGIRNGMPVSVSDYPRGWTVDVRPIYTGADGKHRYQIDDALDEEIAVAKAKADEECTDREKKLKKVKPSKTKWSDLTENDLVFKRPYKALE